LAKKTEAVSIPAPRLLTVKAAAAYLGCAIWAVRSLAYARRVPHVKIGNRTLFDRADLDAYVEAQKVPAL
jgi:excisionase family DNA binding protein